MKEKIIKLLSSDNSEDAIIAKALLYINYKEELRKIQPTFPALFYSDDISRILETDIEFKWILYYEKENI